MARKQDKDTLKVLSEQERIANFVDSPDWAVIKKRFIDKIVLNDSMSALITTGKTHENLAVEVLARAQASAIMLETLQEIEGIARQAKEQTDMLREVRTEQVVHYFGERSEQTPNYQ